MSEPDPRVPSPASGAEALSRLETTQSDPAEQIDPRLRAFFETWLDTFIINGRVPPRLRELAILRVMWRSGQSFEWANHYRLARSIGISDEEILAIRTLAPSDANADVAVVVQAADDVVDRGHLSAATFAASRDLFEDAGLLLEFLYLVAGYRMFASVSASRGASAEARGLPLWPPDGVGPAS